MKNFTRFESKGLTESLLKLAKIYKREPWRDHELGKGRRLGAVFLNPSLRTRNSLQIAADHLGLSMQEMNMSRDSWALEMSEGAIMNADKAEHIREAAGVMGAYFDFLAIRCFPNLVDKEADQSDDVLKQFQKYSKLPTVSLESASRHPLQSLADLMTISEHSKKDQPKVVLTWAPHVKAIPHAVAHSFAEWTLGMDMDLTITQPKGYELSDEFTQGAKISYNQEEAIADADFVYVKNWSAFQEYGHTPKVDEDWLLKESQLQKLAPEAKIMHCLPVRRNVELADELLDGDRSLVLHQAKNRIFTAQAVLATLLKQPTSIKV
ncbi:MAG: acetylornithine carbamoyltransferase [Cyclobacteriaceae bacterium]|nr:acetylornithine carbamoyltransferase [Cyclobacteriaceae bacterium]MCH8515727.1 acetylornithine carbamoyltransferase [Cyclobacteriaceae bacterium]